jgi:hypothetical protein
MDLREEPVISNWRSLDSKRRTAQNFRNPQALTEVSTLLMIPLDISDLFGSAVLRLT